MRKFEERLPTACLLFVLPLPVGPSVRRECVHRRWSIERHRKSMDFDHEGGCGGPYFAAPPTSARVQNRVEFVELARDMSSSLIARRKFKPELISRWYKLSGCGTSSYHALYNCQVHLYHASSIYEYISWNVTAYVL